MTARPKTTASYMPMGAFNATWTPMPIIPAVAPLSNFSESYATCSPSIPNPTFAPSTQLDVERHRYQAAADDPEAGDATHGGRAAVEPIWLPARNSGRQTDIRQAECGARAEGGAFPGVRVWNAHVTVDRDAGAALGVVPRRHSRP